MGGGDSPFLMHFTHFFMQTSDTPVIFILRPHGRWGIIGADLRRVASLSRFMMLGSVVHSETVGHDSDTRLAHIAERCEALQPKALYERYADKRIFRKPKAFWESDDKTVQRYVKLMADRLLAETIEAAAQEGIPMFYATDAKAPLHIEQRLSVATDRVATPVMDFCRYNGHTEYRLSLRLGDSQLPMTLGGKGLTVLTFHPALFILNGVIRRLGDGDSGQLLLPFAAKSMVTIPQSMEKEYFRRFILKNIATVEVNATGFDIEDEYLPPRPRICVETAIDGRQLLSLVFLYGNITYTPLSTTPGRVALQERADGFCFMRRMRDFDAEKRFLERLGKEAPEMTRQGSIFFDTTSEMVEWLRCHSDNLRNNGFDIVQPSENAYYIGPLSVEQSNEWHADWLQTDVTIVLDSGRLRIPFLQLRDTILSGQREYLLPSGERLIIPSEWLERYADILLIARPSGDGFRRHRTQLAGAASNAYLFSTPSVSPLMGKEDTHSSALPPPHFSLTTSLRPYQQTGTEWLWRHLLQQTGCCLSDEMGLGKTIQTIALLTAYKEASYAPKASPAMPLPGQLFSEEEMGGKPTTEQSLSAMPFHSSLVVAPASVVHNWRNELRHFSPKMTVLEYTGAASQRETKRGRMMQWDIVLTTYRTLLNDIDFLASCQWGIIVFDESQAFKTHTSLIHHAVAQLKGLQRIALSGTPVENNLGELWSLMNVLNPSLLGDYATFRKTFVNPIVMKASVITSYSKTVQADAEVASPLHVAKERVLQQLISPYFLKRTKEEVLGELPERQDETVVCPMTDEQISLYAKELSRARNEWSDPHVAVSQRQINILAAIQRLRQIANGEGKMDVVFGRLEQLRSTRHKVLIFSEYVTLLQRVADGMAERGWAFEMLTGATRDRETVTTRFQSDGGSQFFLISLKAGGVGINLTAADYVFLLDPWWNKAAEEQAIARSHRIGQQRPVFVYRFVSENTLEEQILSLQQRKQSLIDSVMPFIVPR